MIASRQCISVFEVQIRGKNIAVTLFSQREVCRLTKKVTRDHPSPQGSVGIRGSSETGFSIAQKKMQNHLGANRIFSAIQMTKRC